MSASGPRRQPAEPVTIAEAWHQRPSPRQEAAACLRVAIATGGVEAMRALISVSDREKSERRIWTEEQPELAAGITEPILYREAVLHEFDAAARQHQHAQKLNMPDCGRSHDPGDPT